MKKGKVIRVENDIVTIGMNNGSIKEVRRCDLGFDPVLGDLVEIFEDEDQIIVTKAKKEPENHNDAGININMTNSINNASDVAAGNGKKVMNYAWDANRDGQNYSDGFKSIEECV